MVLISMYKKGNGIDIPNTKQTLSDYTENKHTLKCTLY